jgi:hypothetical protein
MADFRFVDSGWKKLFADAASLKRLNLKIICPFIQFNPISRLLNTGTLTSVRVITRLNAEDFLSGVSDPRALRLILENGGAIRCVKRLHTKLYIFNNKKAFVTSANLTDAALSRNYEFGIAIDNSKMVGSCSEYFEDIWLRAKSDLTFELLGLCEAEISNADAARQSSQNSKRLRDFGNDIGLPIEEAAFKPKTFDAYVKFFATGSRRRDPFTSIIDEVKRSGSHWAGTYPRNKRPRQVKDGSVMFMACIVPNDILIYGRAIAISYKDGRDDASPADISLRNWKKDWPHYIRITDPEYISGTLSDGVSLRELMRSLGSKAFESTKRNAARGFGNTEPKKSIMRQPAVKLSGEGYDWVAMRLSEAILRHGKITGKSLRKLDKPPKYKSI